MSVRQTFIGTEILVSPGMQAMAGTIEELGDELTVVHSPLYLYLDRLPNMAETETGPLSYYSLAPVEPTYDVARINELASNFMDTLGAKIEEVKPPIDDPLRYIDDMSLDSEGIELPVAARIGLSERIGRVTIRKSVYLNNEIGGGREPSVNKLEDLRHKLVVDIFPDIDSANSGSFKQRRVYLKTGKAERKLKRSAKD